MPSPHICDGSLGTTTVLPGGSVGGKMMRAAIGSTTIASTTIASTRLLGMFLLILTPFFLF